MVTQACVPCLARDTDVALQADCLTADWSPTFHPQQLTLVKRTHVDVVNIEVGVISC